MSSPFQPTLHPSPIRQAKAGADTTLCADDDPCRHLTLELPAAPSAPDGTIFCGALGMPQVAAHTRRIELIWAGDRTVEVEVIVAVVALDPAERARLLGTDNRRMGYSHRSVRLGSANGRPRIVILYRARYRRADGKTLTTPLPAGIDPDSGLHADLVGEIRRDLGWVSLAEIYRRTLAPYQQIEVIAGAIEAAEQAAMAADNFQPIFLAVDGVSLNPQTGKRRVALHIAACDPRRALNATLKLTDFPDGDDGLATGTDVLVQVLRALPAERLVAIATDYGREHGLALAAIARVQAERPGVCPLVVVDPFHIQQPFSKAMNSFRIACWKEIEKKSRRQDKAAVVGRIKRAAKLLNRTRWWQIKEKPEHQALVEQVFKDCPKLETAFWLLEGLRQILSCRTRAQAQKRYDAWCRELAGSGLHCFDEKAEHLEKNWQRVLVLFDATLRGKAEHDTWFSFGTNGVESLNKNVKWLWRYARLSSVALLEQRILARQGYRARKTATAAPTLVRRRRKNDSLAPFQARAKQRRDKKRGRKKEAAEAAVPVPPLAA